MNMILYFTLTIHHNYSYTKLIFYITYIKIQLLIQFLKSTSKQCRFQCSVCQAIKINITNSVPDSTIRYSWDYQCYLLFFFGYGATNYSRGFLTWQAHRIQFMTSGGNDSYFIAHFLKEKTRTPRRAQITYDVPPNDFFKLYNFL